MLCNEGFISQGTEMKKAGGILTIIGASVSFVPILLFLGIGALLELDIVVEEEGTENRVIEISDEATGEEIEEGGMLLIGLALGALFFCAITLGLGIFAFMTKKPLLVGLSIIVCSLIGLGLGNFFASALVLSILGGIFVCLDKPTVTTAPTELQPSES